MNLNPEDITRPAPDAGAGPVLDPPPAPAPTSSNGNGPSWNGGQIHRDYDPFQKLEGEVGLMFRELAEIKAGVQANRLAMIAAAGTLALLVVLMLRAADKGGAS